MDLTRRDLCRMLPAFYFFPRVATEERTLRSGTFPFSNLPVHKQGVDVLRPIAKGTTAKGVTLEISETFLLPGEAPKHAERHSHDEMFFISQGEVEVTISGKKATLGPGSAAFVAAGDDHDLRNAGATPVQYFTVGVSAKIS